MAEKRSEEQSVKQCGHCLHYLPFDGKKGRPEPKGICRRYPYMIFSRGIHAPFTNVAAVRRPLDRHSCFSSMFRPTSQSVWFIA